MDYRRQLYDIFGQKRAESVWVYITVEGAYDAEGALRAAKERDSYGVFTNPHSGGEYVTFRVYPTESGKIWTKQVSSSDALSGWTQTK